MSWSRSLEIFQSAGVKAATRRVQTSQHNLPFQKHEEDLRMWADVFDCRRPRANVTSHNIAEQVNHVFLSLSRKV